MRVLGKAIAFILTFVLGFFACVGAIVGIVFYAYTSISIDSLKGFGVEIETGEYADKDAEVPIDTLTLQKLVEEIQYLASIGDEATLDTLIERYGLKIPEDIEKLIPPAVKDISLASLFSPEGFGEILAATEVDYILGLIPEGIVSDQAAEALSGKTLDYVVAMDLGYLLDGVLLGYVTGVTYEKDEDGNNFVVYADPENPTTLELVAALDLGALLSSITGDGTDTFEVVKSYVGDVMLESLVGTVIADMDSFPLPGLFGDKTLGDLIQPDEETGAYGIDIFALLDDRQLGELLDYVYNAEEDRWYTEADGEPVDALFNAVCFVSCSELMDPGVDSETGETRTQIDVVFDALGDLKLGHLMNYEFGDCNGDGNEMWYKKSGDSITYPDNSEKSFLDIEISTLLGDDPVNDAFGNLYVGELMGYEKQDNPEYNPELDGSNQFIWKDSEGKEIGQLYAKLADYTVSSLMDGGLAADELMDGLVIADVLELTAKEDLPTFIKNGETLTPVNDLEKSIVVWVDKNNVPANNMMNTIAPLSISNVGDEMNTITLGDICGVVELQGKWYAWEYDSATESILLTADESLITDLAHITIEQFTNNDFEDEIQSIKIGRFIGYTLGEDNNWYDDGVLVEGGILSAFIDLDLNDLKNEDTVQSAVQDIDVADVLGFEYDEVEGIWKDGNAPLTGVMREIADCKVGELNNKIQSMKIGDIAGFTQSGDDWFNEAGEPAPGILGVLAGLTINEVTDEKIISQKIKTVTVADVFGYTKAPNGDWLDEGKKVYGVLAVIADAEIGNIQGKLDVTEMGYILGYEKRADGCWWDPDAGTNGKKVDGLMSAVSNTTFNGLGELYTKLTLSDIIPAEQLETGFLSIIPEATTLDQVGTVINDMFNTTSISDLIEKGIVNLDASTRQKLDGVCESHKHIAGREKIWSDYALPDAIQHIVDDLFEIIDSLSSWGNH